MPYPTTLPAVREFRLQGLLEEAARERLAASAVPSRRSQEGVMFGEGHDDSIVQRGIDEALACQDMLARTPVTPSLGSRIATCVLALARALVRRKPAGEPRVNSAVRAIPLRQ